MTSPPVRILLWGRVRNILAVLGALILLTSLRPIPAVWAGWLTGPRWDAPAGDTLIVLGGDGPMEPGVAGFRSYLRCMGVLTAWRAHRFPRIVVSGGHGAAESMRVVLVSLGIPDNVVQTETRSESTRENAEFTAAMLPKSGRGHVALLSSEYHMRRAVREFERAGFQNPIVLPTPDASKRLNHPLLRWNVCIDLLCETAKLVWYTFHP